jgi:predicted metalloprotease with PDZ domain
MKYTISLSDPLNHFITLSWEIENIHQDIIHIQLPSWRPGRYELQNYARNIRNFSIVDTNKNPVTFKKITKDCWELNTANTRTVAVTYEYYANQLDAGASYVDGEFLYLNPVNCFMYVNGRMDEEYSLNFVLPHNYQIASQLEVKQHSLFAKNFDQLADSPLIASANLFHYQFEINSSTQNESISYIHLWFQGTPYENMDRLIDETRRYCEEQIALFGSLPCKDYHFLYHILPVTFRHGVEHLNSTVIAMGPASEWNNHEFYDSFMAISSHELFHLWNVKRIRPSEMLPYDFTKENYSTLGYVYEGITTYYGDIILLRSGVWTWEQYANSFNGDLLKHISNMGRFNYSLAESSFDTWLDGYSPGIPGRKVSIYTEGMLAAFIADALIIDASKGIYSLDDVMKDLFEQTLQQHYEGYTETSYKSLLEKYSGISFDSYFEELIWGKGHFDKWLTIACEKIGLKINLEFKEIDKLQDSNDKQKQYFNSWSQSRVKKIDKN